MRYWFVFDKANGTPLYEVTIEFGELPNGLYNHSWHVYTFGDGISKFTFNEIKDRDALDKFCEICHEIEFGINRFEDDENGGSKPLNSMDDAAKRMFKLSEKISSTITRLVTEFPQLTIEEFSTNHGK